MLLIRLPVPSDDSVDRTLGVTLQEHANRPRCLLAFNVSDQVTAAAYLRLKNGIDDSNSRLGRVDFISNPRDGAGNVVRYENVDGNLPTLAVATDLEIDLIVAERGRNWIPQLPPGPPPEASAEFNSWELMRLRAIGYDLNPTWDVLRP